MISATQRTTIVRSRLDARFARASAYPVTIVLGDVGSGKSIAVGDYLDGRAIPYVRYAVDADASPKAFVQGLAAAIAPLAPGAILSASIAFDLASKGASPWIDLAAWLKEHVQDRNATVVVDGLIERESGAIAELLTTLVEQTQPRLRWILAGRDLSALPIASWLARGFAGTPINADDLRFSIDDAAALAALHGRPGAPVGAIVERMNGWPLGVTFAIDMLADPGDLAAVPADHRSALAHFSRISLSGRSAAELAFFRAASALPDLDRNVLDALDAAATAAFFPALYARNPWMFTENDPPRMRGEVRRVLAEIHPGAAYAPARDLARALERAGRWADAIGLLLETDLDEVAELIERHGLALIDEGRRDIVDAALERLSQTAHAERPNVLGLRALAASELGHFDLAEAWFRIAIRDSADQSQRLALAHHFALDAMRRNHPESVERLASLLPGGPHRPLPIELAMRATLATAYAAGEKHEQAAAAIEDVLRQIDGEVPPSTLARIMHQSAFIAMRRGDFESARTFAGEAIAVAESVNAHDVIARATTVLVEISLHEDDPLASLEHLEEFARFGLLSGNPQMRVFGLLAALDVETERGNIEAIESIVVALGGRELVQHAGKINESFLPAEAMRQAWSGNFERAFGLVHEAGASETRAPERAARHAELAVYAALCYKTQEAAAALEASETELAGLPLIARGGRTYALLALAALLLGDPAHSRNIVTKARERGFGSNVRTSALFWAIDALVDYAGSSHGTETLTAALCELDRQELGGYRLLVEAIPAARLSVLG